MYSCKPKPPSAIKKKGHVTAVFGIFRAAGSAIALFERAIPKGLFMKLPASFFDPKERKVVTYKEIQRK